jgi:hypothetical protein
MRGLGRRSHTRSYGYRVGVGGGLTWGVNLILSRLVGRHSEGRYGWLVYILLYSIVQSSAVCTCEIACNSDSYGELYAVSLG